MTSALDEKGDEHMHGLNVMVNGEHLFPRCEYSHDRVELLGAAEQQMHGQLRIS